MWGAGGNYETEDFFLFMTLHYPKAAKPYKKADSVTKLKDKTNNHEEKSCFTAAC